jgi:hypothetical protein
MELLWSYIKKSSIGMVDEKVTFVSSVMHTCIPRPRWKLRLGSDEKWDQC